jgi:RNA polymerase sigma-70 factor (ECF subfamily)
LGVNGASLEELERLYLRRREVFLGVATAITHDDSLAADALHDGFVAAVRSRRSFRGEGSLDGWVWRLVVNAARRLAAERPGPAAPPEAAVAARNGSPDEPDGTIRSVVAALPERQRLVVFLRYYADLDYNAIAEALDVQPGTVAATLNAARGAIRRQLEEGSLERP